MVAEAASPCLVEVEGKVLHPDDVSGVRGSKPDIGHDGDNHVLLHVELARVEGPRVAESGEHLVGEGNLEQLAGRKSSEKEFVRRVTHMKGRFELTATGQRWNRH